MLWVLSKSIGDGFRHALARGACSALAVCTLAGCFLDESHESPRTAASGSPTSSTQTDGGKRGFVPRDPPAVRTRTGNVDAATTAPGSGDPTGAADPADASSPSVTPKSDAQVASATDAQVVPLVDAQVTSPTDAMTRPPVSTSDAQVADAATPAVDAGPPPSAAVPQPIHRYEFNGAMRVARDSIGNADGELQGRAYLAGMGEVQLGGMYEDAVVLPPRILSGLSSFSLLGWMVPRSRECTQRLFEFIYYREGQQRTQVSALYLAPYACPDDMPAVGYLTERMYYNVVSDQPLAGPREQVLLGAMYDASTQELQLIVNGVVAQSMMVPLQERELSFAQGSLGRSSPEGNNNASGGSIAEFRIYDQTLDAAALAEIARRGPDQL